MYSLDNNKNNVDTYQLQQEENIFHGSQFSIKPATEKYKINIFTRDDPAPNMESRWVPNH